MKLRQPGLCFAALAVLLHPVFFVIYRLAAFSTVPRDDYAPFLLWLLGEPGGALPGSPYGYRLLSMVAAAPFYYALPLLPLTNMPADLSAPYLKATAALSALAFLAWIANAMLTYACAIAAHLERRDAVIAGALAFVLMLYVQITAIDPLAIALISAGILLVRRPWPFATLVAVSVPINEKVAMVLAVWLVIRCALSRADRAELGWRMVTAVLGVAAYVALVRAIHLPANAYQLDPTHYGSTLRDNLAAYASPRGLLLNVLPILVLAAIALAGRPCGLFRRTDTLVIPALIAVALVLTQFFQAGRIVMHAAPLFVVPAAATLSGWFARVGDVKT